MPCTVQRMHMRLRAPMRGQAGGEAAGGSSDSDAAAARPKKRRKEKRKGGKLPKRDSSRSQAFFKDLL